MLCSCRMLGTSYSTTRVSSECTQLYSLPSRKMSSLRVLTRCGLAVVDETFKLFYLTIVRVIFEFSSVFLECISLFFTFTKNTEYTYIRFIMFVLCFYFYLFSCHVVVNYHKNTVKDLFCPSKKKFE